LSSKELRFYKGKYAVRILIKGNRKGKHGPITYGCEALENIPLGTFSYKTEFGCANMIEAGERFTTIPRLLWTNKNDSTKEAT
jgi:hypothetical protein